MLMLIRQGGGLGNQLFQYAAGRYYAERYHADLYVVTESQKNPQCLGDPRPFLLSKFKIKAPYRELNLIDNLLVRPPGHARPILEMLERHAGIQVIRVPYGEHHIFKPDLPIRSNAQRVYLSGFWQFHNHLTVIEEKLRAELQFREPPQGKNREVLERIHQDESPVSIHVRRTDLVHCYGAASVLSTDYYSEAIQAISDRVHSPTFYVFSEEMAFARSHFPNNTKMVFVDHNDSASGHEDLRLMAACRHNIIANSSLSWWGAWLNTNHSKFVIAPEHWLRQEISYADLIPKDWLLVGDQAFVS